MTNPLDGDDAWQPVVDANGLTIEAYARITAEMAEGTMPAAEVLAGNGLDDKQWAEATRYWMQAMAEDVQRNGVDGVLALHFSDAFSVAQDELKSAPEMTPEDYAQLVVDIQRRGSPKEPLGERRLSLADYNRLARRFAALFVRDPLAHKRFFDTYARLQPKPRR